MANRGQQLLDEFVRLIGDETRVSEDGSLLETLLEAAQQCTSKQPIDRLIKFLENQTQAENGTLCHTISFGTEGQTIGFLCRLMWLPRGLPGGRISKKRIGFASSRLGRSPDDNPHWFDCVRTIAARIDNEKECIVCTQSTAGFEFYRRAAWLFGVDCVEASLADTKLSAVDWLLKLPELGTNKNSDSDEDENRFPVFISPKFDFDAEANGVTVDCNDRDSMHASMCDTIYALRVSSGGNTQTALARRLSHGGGTVFLSTDSSSVSKKSRERLVDLGAVQHHLIPSADESEEANSVQVDAIDSQFLTVDEVELRFESCMTHCTRRRIGPWPDEDEATFIDDLLFRRFGANHSAIASLCRIIRMEKLVATTELIRGEQPVVSFTENPLSEVLDAHTFRSHLSRWDFEPYGICVDKSVLLGFGAASVIYGDDSKFEELEETESHLFQKINDDGVDWTLEREWRVADDLELNKLPRDSAIVFVPTQDEAEFVRPFTRFDVCVTGR